jgi:hypothetical protein
VKHTFHPEALEEYLGAVSYYADISPRLAEAFIDSFESGILTDTYASESLADDRRGCEALRYRAFSVWHLLLCRGRCHNDLCSDAHEPCPKVLEK